MRMIDIHIPMSPNWLTLGPELDIGESEANTMIEQSAYNNNFKFFILIIQNEHSFLSFM